MALAHLKQLVEIYRMVIMVATDEDTILVDRGVRVVVETVGSFWVNSKRSYQIPPLTKQWLKILSTRYARNLATQQQCVGSGLCRQECQIHMDVVSLSLVEETEVHKSSYGAHGRRGGRFAVMAEDQPYMLEVTPHTTFSTPPNTTSQSNQ